MEVRFRDCDAMGHVNNAVYFTYFEQARAVMAEMLGLRRELARSGLGVILAHTSCDYKAQVVFGDQVEVGVRIVKLGRTSFTSDFEARRVRTTRSWRSAGRCRRCSTTTPAGPSPSRTASAPSSRR